MKLSLIAILLFTISCCDCKKVVRSEYIDLTYDSATVAKYYAMEMAKKGVIKFDSANPCEYCEKKDTVILHYSYIRHNGKSWELGKTHNVKVEILDSNKTGLLQYKMYFTN